MRELLDGPLMHRELRTALDLREARESALLAPVPDFDIAPESGYAVQAALFGDGAVAAWKIGLTGSGIRAAMGAAEPAAGRLTADAIVRSPATLPVDDDGEYYVEGELVIEIARDLPDAGRPYTKEEVATAIGAVHAGIEVVTSRFASSDLPLGLLLADNCMAHRLVIGNRIADGWEERFATHPALLAGPGDAAAQGCTSNVMGNPLIAVTWLANWLIRSGSALRAGQWVSSGTATGVTPVNAGDRIDFGLPGLGNAQVNFISNEGGLG